MTTSVEKCRHCGGTLSVLGKDRQQREIKRCVSCGRDASENAPQSPPKAASAAIAERIDLAAAGIPAPPGAKCSVAGCPGYIVSGRCGCCEKRAAWKAEHLPDRRCEICGGKISGSKLKTFCGACRSVANVVKTLKRKEAAKAHG
jgi:hypothetical protein